MSERMGAMVVAEVEGRVLASVTLDGERAIVDPFSCAAGTGRPGAPPRRAASPDAHPPRRLASGENATCLSLHFAVALRQ